jgi:hypothetical protein
MRFVRCKTTSGYEAMILTPEQAYAIVCNLREPERTLTLLAFESLFFWPTFGLPTIQSLTLLLPTHQLVPNTKYSRRSQPSAVPC